MLEDYISQLKNISKLHPLQKKRINLDVWYNQERDKLESEYRRQLEEIQNECNHIFEDGKSAWDNTSPPFSESYCRICNKYD